MHICVSKLIIIGSDDGFSPGQCQTIIWTNAEILLIRLLEQTSVKSQSWFIYYSYIYILYIYIHIYCHSIKCIWKCHPQGCHFGWHYWRVYMKDKSSVHFIFYIVESSHAHQHCLHAWPTLIHGNSGHIAVRAGARERCLMNRSLDARTWSACSWLLYCSMQRVMFRPCTHLSDHDTWSNQKVTWSNTCPSRDWPYVMSRQNNQTERDQLMVNSLLYEWCTFPWL